jgi:tRNA (guanine37-N1)-methyltransferase
VTWTARVLTLFPEMFPGPLGHSLAGRALERGDWALETVDIRDFARDKHRSVDDAPFGGGAGMVMLPGPIDAAIQAVRRPGERLFYPSPRGRLIDQALVREVAAEPAIVILCGRYEGVDQRVLDAQGAEEISLGDFVLSGGEPAALALIDAVVRLLPGVMGNEESAGEESFGSDFGAGLLEYPHYSRPAEWQGADGVPRAVPEVLLSGHHARVRRWRLEQAESITRERRPDLWQRYRAAQGDAGHVRKRPGKPTPHDGKEEEGPSS